MALFHFKLFATIAAGTLWLPPAPRLGPSAHSHSDSDCESKLHKARSNESGETLVGQVRLLVGARSEGKSELRDYRLAE